MGIRWEGSGVEVGKYIKKMLLLVGMETVTISKKEYGTLKKQAKIDVDLLQQLMSSFADIKAGRVRRVR